MIERPHLANFFVAFVAQTLTVTRVRLRSSLLVASNFTQMRTSSKARYAKGFTLLELLIVIGVIALLSGIILSSFTEFRNSKVLDTAVEDVLTVISQARGDTLA